MDKKLYDMMDWAAVEGIVYSEEDHPGAVLGPQVTKAGVLLQAYIPTAESITVLTGDGAEHPMDMEDETGFFAALLPGKKIPDYRYRVTFDNGSVSVIRDAYAFGPQIDDAVLRRFSAGIATDIYRYLGAHPMTVNGVDGVLFAVWAPNALRVSVVGDFVLWDGRRLPMNRRGDSGVFELFVPGVGPGTMYKYEIKTRSRLTFLKADPYGTICELRPGTASIVAPADTFAWTDGHWMEQRSADAGKDLPMAVYEVHPGTFARPDDGREFYTWRELAPMVASHVLEMGYTHVELTPVMEHSEDGCGGMRTTGYFAPTSRHGSPEDLQYFVNYLHEKGIGVILAWTPAYFARDISGLCGFDGTCLYEHLDPRQGYNRRHDTLIFNYGRPEVSCFLIANALYWKDVYHADGIRAEDAASMLYLDYDRGDGEWVANMYGGNENLEAVDFFKNLSKAFHKAGDGAVLIAEESALWPQVTAMPEDGGLGFDYKWNDGWCTDFMGYMQLDPIFRGPHHGELTFSMVYHYSEHYMLSLSHAEANLEKGSLLSRMPGRRAMKFANLRAALGYTVMHPGKKLLFMGQDEGVKEGWDPAGAPIAAQTGEDNLQLKAFVRDLLHLYRSQRALYALDYQTEGFEWINSISANENMLVFLRKSGEEDEMLLVVCNFSALAYENHKIGVPFSGKYKEIFSSDHAEYGGSGNLNPRVKSSKKEECDGRENSIRIKVPPMGVCVFTCTRVEEKESPNEKAIRTQKSKAKTAAGKEAARGVVKAQGAKGSAASKGKKKSLKEDLREKIEVEGE